MDIYSRVSELISEKKAKLSDADVFLSPEYARYIRRKAENIITGSFYELRRMGFDASERAEKALIRSLTVEVAYLPTPPDNAKTAYCSSDKSGRKHTIWLNTGNLLIQKGATRAEKHWAILGMLYHEIGHLLYTDYPSLHAWLTQLNKGVWFPKAPDGLNTVNGINLSARMGDPVFCDILTHCAKHIENALEDSYVEEEIKEQCPGRGSECLNAINDILIENAASLEEDDENEEVSEFNALMRQVLLYAKFGEMNLGDYSGELLDPLYDSLDLLDKVRYQRDSLRRLNAYNEMCCILFPYLEKDIDDAIQNAQQNGAGGTGAGAGGAGGGSIPGSGTGSSGGGAGDGIPSGVAEAIKKAMQQIANQSGATNANDDCSSTAINDPTAAKNAGAPAEQDGSGSNGGNGGSGDSGSGSRAGTSSEKAAERELGNIEETIANNQANEQAEKERTAEMNAEAKNIDCSDLGLSGKISVSIKRAESVSDKNRRAYDEAVGAFQEVSRDLQRDIKRVLKDRREGGVLKNLPFGRRFEVSSVVHNDGKYFSRRKLPTETPRLGVGLLVDESGSTSGTLISAATCAALVIEDFCRELEIPHIINGYTTGAKDALIFSYAEPNEIDDGNRYRITGMSARSGTPTKAALAYMTKRMNQLDVDVKLLIVITDGASGDNDMNGDGVRAITRIIESAKRDNVLIVAAGIGSNRSSVEREFGENFLDISDLHEMPEQLVTIIKDNLWV